MAAGYWRDALKSRSYWKYALFSPGAAAKFMAAIGFLYLLVDAADFLMCTLKTNIANMVFYL